MRHPRQKGSIFRMKKLLLIATGGTIASRPSENGLAPALSAEQLLAAVPEVSALCEIEVRQLFSIDSTNMTPSLWLRIAAEIRGGYEDFDGFVITHGTDTMAYTAAALSYLIQGASKPIVLTGSQRPMGDDITDARRNLLDSFRFASQDGVGGVYIVFDGKAILGTRARKMRTKSFDAFESVNFPVAAFLDDRRIVTYVSGSGNGNGPAPVSFCDHLNESVFVLKLIPGIDPAILSYLGEHYDVIVIESYGVGGIPFQDENNFLKEVEDLSARGKIVVIATQVMLEGSDADRYEVGAIALRRLHLLQSYDMTIEAVVTKLMWITGQTRDFAEVARLFYTPVASDILYTPE